MKDVLMLIGSSIVCLLPGLGRSQSLVWNSDSISNFSFTASGTGNSFSPASPVTSPSGIWDFNGGIILRPNTPGPGFIQMSGGGSVTYTPGGLRYIGAPGPDNGPNINTTQLFQEQALFLRPSHSYWVMPEAFPFEASNYTDNSLQIGGSFGYPDNEHFLYSGGISSVMNFTITSASDMQDITTWNWTLIASGSAAVSGGFTVPEPSSAVLLLSGALVCLRCRRLRRS